MFSLEILDDSFDDAYIYGDLHQFKEKNKSWVHNFIILWW